MKYAVLFVLVVVCSFLVIDQALAGYDGCPGCPMSNGGNCNQCCIDKGSKGGGSCSGFMWTSCWCTD
ncbi:hypothetical protein RvY_02813 [Ramazzottius varieornatus]|uniref:Uncharacterized protein n=1 Tax=Ramazzottius varieornatus TaxID=947166 RepID=A0A1D1UVJ4_RAMVA|nr:hypothetical protein RvY_02813 [Ramazzottius varieornatus]